MCSIAIAGFALSAVSGVVSFIGQRQQAQVDKQAARDEGEFRQAVLRNQQTAIEQDITAEKRTEQIRQQLIAREGATREGEIRVAQAALGQLVDVGSAADITTELAGEIEFRKLVSQHESDLRKRNLAIESDNIQADIGLTGLQTRREVSEAQSLGTSAFGTLLTTGSTLARSFRFQSGSLAFS